MAQSSRPRRRQLRLWWGIGILLVIGGIVASAFVFNRGQTTNL